MRSVRTASLAAVCLLLLADGAFAGDGRIAMERENADAGSSVWTVREDGTDARRVVAHGAHPSWAPDATRIAYVRGGSLHVVRPSGGDDVRVVRGVAEGRAAWSPDGRRLAFSRDGALWVVAADGSGRPRRLTAPRTGVADTDPAWAPDRAGVAFTRTTTTGEQPYPLVAHEIAVVSPATGEVQVLGEGAQPAWSPDGGRIAFVSDRDRNGDVYTGNGTTRPTTELYAMRADGTGAERLTTTAGDEASPSWSPDGRDIVVASAVRTSATGRWGGQSELALVPADRGCLRVLTNLPRAVSSPSWEPVRSDDTVADVPCTFMAPAVASGTSLAAARSAHVRAFWLGQRASGYFLTWVNRVRRGFVALDYADCSALTSPYCEGTRSPTVESSDACTWSIVTLGDAAGAPDAWRTLRGTLVAVYDDGRTYDVLAGRTLVELPADDELVGALRPLGAPEPVAGAPLPPPVLSTADRRALLRATTAVRRGGERAAARSLHIDLQALRARVSIADALRGTGVRTTRC